MNPQEHQIKAYFTNKSQAPLENVSLQAAVQKYMKLTLQPIANNMIAVSSTRQITQDMTIIN